MSLEILAYRYLMLDGQITRLCRLGFTEEQIEASVNLLRPQERESGCSPYRDNRGGR